MSKRVLGKGLSAIISGSPVSVDEIDRSIIEDKDRIVHIPIELIKSNPDQPRSKFDEEGIKELAESLKSVGLLHPIIVREDGENYYVIAGERRLRAAEISGMETISSLVIKASEEENLTIALIENIQRKDLNPIEEANAYRVLINRFNLRIRVNIYID